ncbi:MAG: hypothetical protein LBO74_09495 [Candidatus Symbiothrix sp.]|jgi:hypothetical protein|nr:hypothetical protein [Candidatus Symbiothrix sp.]
MKHILSILCVFLSLSSFAQTVYIDQEGVMRWSDSRKEASFYGVNYTLPFAHAYRAINYTGKNHKEAIDKDVYHFARLGFNAYRVHVWDVEISDSTGNIIENEHLDLLDYLIAKLQERNIRIVLTTMTNFGNGYPEKNKPTGGFSYLYDKCKVHSDPNAIAAQTKYISQFVKHVNPYTRQALKDDPYIIGFEINNEPCHAETPAQTKEYINTMLATLKKAGNSKPVFYNVSHNMPHVAAYYDTNIQGTTYQWYPVGLVAGHTRKGNFLPYVDDYAIPFSNVKGFDKKAKLVYEFDPADVTYSYLYPAMARTFRSKGFQWITQFAYDPIDIAWANTEYQTHFLNLAYTPRKALSMKIAAEVAYSVPRNASFAKYPNDTVFNAFHVSYLSDLSELNTPEKFFYSNHTISNPVAPGDLKEIAGYGNSVVVQYEGTGAYFLDRLESGLWRLEVMPDAVQVRDPFEKPSLKKEVVSIVWNRWNMQVKLLDLGTDFKITALNAGNSYQTKSSDSNFAIQPGVYLLERTGHTSQNSWTASSQWKNISLGEFAAPESPQTFPPCGGIKGGLGFVHQPKKIIESNQPLRIEAQIVDTSFPDSVLVYTDKVSFWFDNNPYWKMKRIQGYTYQAEIPAEMIQEGVFKYDIVVFTKGHTYTFPANVEGSPLDWDAYQTAYWESRVVNAGSPVELVRITDENNGMELYSIPEWSFTGKSLKIVRKYIKDQVEMRPDALHTARYLCVQLKNSQGIDRLKAGFITSAGFTYTAGFKPDKENGLVKIPLSELRQDKTALLPSPYPVFLERYFTPDSQIPFDISTIEMFEIATVDEVPQEAMLSLGNVWIE